jgi:hypothetical protein
MKKLLLALMPLGLIAQSFMLSNIPLPKTYVQDLDPYECDKSCMQGYLDNGQIFSFLSHAYKKLDNMQQNEARIMFVSILNLGSFHNGKKLKIAMLLPVSKIGKYASSTTKATFAYLMTKSHPFALKSYNLSSENFEELQKNIYKIQADGFNYVIAPLTKKGVENIIEINPSLHIYFPTINKKDVNTTSPYLTFGAIDYAAQSQLLLKEALSPLVIFSDNSATGKRLAKYQKEEFLHPTPIKNLQEDVSSTTSRSSFFGEVMSVFEDEKEISSETPLDFDENKSLEEEKKVINYTISRRTTNLESYLKDNEKIVDGSFFINTPIIKSGMIMSQLTLYDTNTTNILSTQINYDPLLLSMTQYIDRKDMVVANSITEHNNILIETNTLLGNNIVYDWINYTTTVGVDYFYSLITNESRIYNTKIIQNQMVYEIELLQPSYSKFKPYERPYRAPKDFTIDETLEETQK